MNRSVIQQLLPTCSLFLQSENKMYSIHTRGTSCILKVAAAALEMSGVYECEVYKDTTKTTVTVEGEVFAAYTVDK